MPSCTACRAELPSRARFCPECGRRIEGSEAVRDPHAAEERRQLSVLFADLVGSVAHAEGLDPEEWREILVRYHELAAAQMTRFGGRVTQYLGDGVLACFGYPRAHEDDPERAVRAGLALVEAMDGVGIGDAALRIRVGIHTGLTVVSEAEGQISVFGETANLAARVQGQALPDTVLVTDFTRRRIEGRFVLEAEGETRLKGLQQPVSLFRVVRPIRVRGTAELAARGPAPLVGRDEELELLLEAWRRAAGGRGCARLVIGEAGVGKSRLLLQLAERLGAEPHQWLECRCTPYTQGTALRPVAELIEEELQLAAAARPRERLALLDAELARRRLPREPMLPVLAEFLGLPAEAGYEPAVMSAEFKRFATLDVLGRWLLRVSEERPLVFLLEDLHWCDPSTLELFGRLLRDVGKARLLLVATGRPDLHAPWPEDETLSTLRLGRLAAPQARDLVRSLDVDGDLAEAVVEGIVDRADGVPLFVEELTKTVLENRGRERSGTSVPEIPTTLQGSLLARLDRLSSAREVAQRASVLGREFGFDLAVASVGLGEAKLRDGLSELVEAGIVLPQGEPPGARFQFRHALLQEAAYTSLLRRTRRELHGRVVDALLGEFAEQGERAPEVVARHAEAAGRPAIAIDHYERASRQAMERSAGEEAIAHAHRAIDLVPQLPDAERTSRELSLQLELGAALTGCRGYAHPERQAAFERARELAETVGDAVQLGLARIGVSISLSTRGEADAALALASQVLEDADKRGDEELALHGLCQVAQAEYALGRFAGSLDHCERGIGIYDPDRHHKSAYSLGGDTGMACIGLSAWNLWFAGRPDAAVERARRCQALSEYHEYPFGLGYSAGVNALLHWLRRDYARQRACAAYQVEIGERYGFPFWIGVGKALHGAARVLDGDGDGMAEAMEGLATSARTGARNGTPMLISMLAEMQVALGDPVHALATIEAARAASVETGQCFWDAELLRMRGELLGAVPEPDAGVDGSPRRHFEKALATARRQGARSLELRAATSLARDLLEGGEPARARELLAPVVAGFDEGLDAFDLRAAGAVLRRADP